MINRLGPTAVITILTVAACGSPQDETENGRDLTLAPVEATSSVFNDRPQIQPVRIGQSYRETEAPRTPLAVQPEERESDPSTEPELDHGDQPSEPATLAEPPAPPTLGGGYALDLTLLESINTGEQGVGSPVSATLRAPVFNDDGDLVVPAGAVFRGTISEVAAYEGRVELAFTSVAFNEAEYPVETVTATVTEEIDESEAKDDLPGRGFGGGVAIVDTRGQGIGRSPDGPVVVISGGTGIGCNAPRSFFPFGTSTFRSIWAGR